MTNCVSNINTTSDWLIIGIKLLFWLTNIKYCVKSKPITQIWFLFVFNNNCLTSSYSIKLSIFLIIIVFCFIFQNVEKKENFSQSNSVQSTPKPQIKSPKQMNSILKQLD